MVYGYQVLLETSDTFLNRFKLYQCGEVAWNLIIHHFNKIIDAIFLWIDAVSVIMSEDIETSEWF